MSIKRVLVASTNPCKVEACKLSFEKVFGIQFDFIPISSKSGVSDQPIGEEETRQGAINRVVDALKTYRQKNDSDPDFVVGLEGGLKDDKLPISDKEYVDSMMLFAWMAVFQPCQDRWGFGRTGSFYLPPEIVSLVHGGMELGFADDQFFKRVKSGQGSGYMLVKPIIISTVGILTDNIISRDEYYKHALILTLIPFIHPELYPVMEKN